VINSISASPSTVIKGTEVVITANATDNSAVDSVWIKINGGAVNYSMTKASLLSGNRSARFSDDFELGTLNAKSWSVTGTGRLWTASTNDAMNGNYIAEAHQTGAGNPSYMEKSIDTTGYQNVTLSYYKKLVGLDVADEFAVEWYDGAGWVSLESTGANSSDDANYTFKTFNISSAADNNPNFKIRFTCECGAVSEYCRLDNITLSAIASGGSADLWKYPYTTSVLSATGIYNYTVYANDTSGNNAISASGNFSITESNITISESVLDSGGNAVNTTLEILDENNATVYNQTSTVHSYTLPKGKYKIKIKPQSHKIKQIYYLINRDEKKLVIKDESSVVYVPLKKIICMSTTHLAMVAALGEEGGNGPCDPGGSLPAGSGGVSGRGLQEVRRTFPAGQGGVSPKSARHHGGDRNRRRLFQRKAVSRSQSGLR
jgi:hypothetical protein